MIAYIALPYSHPDQWVKTNRMAKFATFDADLMRSGIFTVSPMHKVFMLPFATFPDTWEYWRDYSHELMKMCDKVVVLQLDGWETSVGVCAEIEMAKKLGLPIEYATPATE